MLVNSMRRYYPYYWSSAPLKTRIYSEPANPRFTFWRYLAPVERLAVADQADYFALKAVRLVERERYPDLTEDEFNWRVIRWLQGSQTLGRE